MLFFKACIKEDIFLTFLILGFILTIFFTLIKISLFAQSLCFVEVCAMSTVIYLQMKSLNISWICTGKIPFQYLKTVFAIQYSPYSLAGSHNLGQNICRLFHVLAQFLFTISETELEYYHQNMKVRVASRVAERLKTSNLRKLGNFKKIAEMFLFDGE